MVKLSKEAKNNLISLGLWLIVVGIFIGLIFLLPRVNNTITKGITPESFTIFGIPIWTNTVEEEKEKEEKEVIPTPIIYTMPYYTPYVIPFYTPYYRRYYPFYRRRWRRR